MKTSGIGKIVRIDNPELVYLLGNTIKKARKIEVAVDDDGARFCIDDGIWTPPYGELIALPVEE